MKTRQSVRGRGRRVRGSGLQGVAGRVPSRGVDSDALYKPRCDAVLLNLPEVDKSKLREVLIPSDPKQSQVVLANPR